VPRTKGGRGAWGLLCLTPLLLALTTCGIENGTVIYSAPTFSYSGNILTLRHSTANAGQDGFQGYDIYYRVYTSQTAADSDRVAIEALASNTTTYTPEAVVTKMTGTYNYRLIQNVFYDLSQSYVQGVSPLFSIDTSTASTATTFTIQPENTSSKSWYYTSTLDSNKYTNYIYRTTTSSNSEKQKSFNGQYVTSEADYAGNYTSSSNSLIYYVFFAVAHGVVTTPTQLFKDVYSVPLSLYATISFTIPY
jgi:hypothetical protein